MQALSIGELAQEAIEGAWVAKVIGVTSGGIFVIAREKRVLFFTYSPFHSPSTVNLERSFTDLRQNEIGAAVKLGNGQIHLPDSGLSIELDGARIWRPGPVKALTQDQRSGIVQRLERAALAAEEQKGEQGLAPVLSWIAQKGAPKLAGDVTEKVLAGINDLRIAIQEFDIAKMLLASGLIVGHGRGLTPAGDDCLAGVLLTLNRWRTEFHQAFDLSSLNSDLLALARAKTTSLSATIIEAAALGQGDERILRVLDGIMTGEWNETESIQDLVRMGHSSGVDSLVGIGLVLTA
jgi:hypothetical protein